MKPDWRAARFFIKRHWPRMLDFFSVITVTLLALYAALTVNIFTDAPHQPQRAETLELDELLLVLGILLAGLLWAVRRLIRERQELARRGEAEREIRRLAFQDPLTGLPNRRRFEDALRAAIAAPPRPGASHALLLLDLNGFKRVNDVHGHKTGDELLIHVGARIARALREGDMVARLGGDEFVVLATHLSGPEAATNLALRIIDEFGPEIRVAGRGYAIGTAIGIALMPQDGNEPGELLRKADIALYRAKDQGISALRFFEPEMDRLVRERDALERDLRAAIAAREIAVLYQPLTDFSSGRVQGFEVQPRWARGGGPVPPPRFIAIAEDSGLIAPLSDLLLERACAEAAGWPAAVRLIFNVSPMLIRDGGFARRVMDCLRAQNFPPGRLELEISESAIVRDLEAARACLGGLHESGVRIALRDFGTGYSSLYHLRHFKVDKVKIGRQFIDRMATDQESAQIVRALVGLGRGLGLEVSAEGVTTNEQWQLLADEGCRLGHWRAKGTAVSGAEAACLLRAGPVG